MVVVMEDGEEGPEQAIDQEKPMILCIFQDRWEAEVETQSMEKAEEAEVICSRRQFQILPLFQI